MSSQQCVLSGDCSEGFKPFIYTIFSVLVCAVPRYVCISMSYACTRTSLHLWLCYVTYCMLLNPLLHEAVSHVFSQWGWLSELCPIADSQDDSHARSGRFYPESAELQKAMCLCVFTASALKGRNSLSCNLLGFVGQRALFYLTITSASNIPVEKGTFWSRACVNGEKKTVVYVLLLGLINRKFRGSSGRCIVTPLVFWSFVIRLL